MKVCGRVYLHLLLTLIDNPLSSRPTDTAPPQPDWSLGFFMYPDTRETAL